MITKPAENFRKFKKKKIEFIGSLSGIAKSISIPTYN